MRKNYHVTKTENGWQGKLEKGQRASVVGGIKNEVVQKTIEIAKNQSSASVRIHKMDGKIQEERTYPQKTDPYSPRG
ncbi:MAG: DUF2188 domain-containing protein [Prevotella sp.]|jgi:hypothetical protein|nr:DUF2188 domain-containing protein [Prevotella sp.]